jgi:elongation factor Ts
MAEISAEMVRKLRDKTGAGMMDCKKALAEVGGDEEKAIEFLRKKGLKDVSKRAERVAAEGLIFCYTHPGSRVGVMVELNCETDFVGRGDDMKNAAKEIAMHIAWAAPRYVSRDDVPANVIEKEKEIMFSQLNPEQQKMADKILVGKIEKFYEENCLLEQVDARDSSGKKKMIDVLNDISLKVGEKVVLRRFSRYEVGEGIEKKVVDYAKEVEEATRV